MKEPFQVFDEAWVGDVVAFWLLRSGRAGRRCRELNDRFDNLVLDQRYFACRDEVSFLEEDVVEVLGLFCGRFEGCGALRAEYNEGFVRREAERFAGFFAGLEGYPLSGDQDDYPAF